jgi:hypothetical protein
MDIGIDFPNYAKPKESFATRIFKLVGKLCMNQIRSYRKTL